MPNTRDTHSDQVTITVFPPQTRLHERASMLLLHVAYNVCLAEHLLLSETELPFQKNILPCDLIIQFIRLDYTDVTGYEMMHLRIYMKFILQTTNMKCIHKTSLHERFMQQNVHRKQVCAYPSFKKLPIRLIKIM
jgi:hypothetical protein